MVPGYAFEMVEDAAIHGDNDSMLILIVTCLLQSMDKNTNIHVWVLKKSQKWYHGSLLFILSSQSSVHAQKST